ncbi:MAG: hypothetical protein H6834_09790 [Planctomycetes bacterium]|nr:hypothetical protein [Planctomycetota bacterium]
MNRPLLAFAIFLALAPSAQSQSLLALDDASAFPSAQLHEFTADHPTQVGCQPIAACRVPAFAQGIPVPAGDLAFGTCSSTLWMTDGFTSLENIDLACNSILSCPLPPIGTAPFTGLSLDEDGGAMYLTDSSAIHVLQLNPGGCPTLPGAHQLCTLPIGPLTPPITGIAYDRTRSSKPFGRTAWWVVNVNGLVVLVERVGNLCYVPLNYVPFLVTCPSGVSAPPITGITHDSCNDLLYFPDALGNVVTMQIVTTAAGTLTGMPYACCTAPLPFSSRMVGLAWRARAPQSYGTGCSGALCPSCTPSAFAVGDPIQGSRCFALDVVQAPFPSIGILALNVLGGTPVLVGLCGPVWVSFTPPPVLLAPLTMVAGAGTPPCHGTTRVALPIPVDPALCHATLYAQYALACPSLDFALSDGLAVTVQ